MQRVKELKKFNTRLKVHIFDIFVIFYNEFKKRINCFFVILDQGEFIQTEEAVISEKIEDETGLSDVKKENTITLSSEEKTVKIVPQIKILGQQNTPTLQLMQKGKVTILGKAGQIINLSQNGKQSAILLLSTADPKVMKFLKINTTNGETLKAVAVDEK